MASRTIGDLRKSQPPEEHSHLVSSMPNGISADLPHPKIVGPSGRLDYFINGLVELEHRHELKPSFLKLFAPDSVLNGQGAVVGDGYTATEFWQSYLSALPEVETKFVSRFVDRHVAFCEVRSHVTSLEQYTTTYLGSIGIKWNEHGYISNLTYVLAPATVWPEHRMTLY